MEHTKISLEQWRALVAVVEAGSYAAAAEAVNKSASTLNYAIDRIETLLGLELFHIEGRRAVLTASGRTLYRRAKALLDESGQLERLAGRLAAGEEAELRLAAEIIFPTWLLLECLDALSADFPNMRIQLHESVLGGTSELLTRGAVDLAIASSVPPGFVGDPLMRLRFIAAAAPHHPLHQLDRSLTLDDLRQHRHLVIRDSGSQPASSAAWEVSEKRWTVTSKATSIRAACMGLGFAWYAEDIIRQELDSGQLQPLPLEKGRERDATLYLVFADADGAGPGTRRLAELLQQQPRSRKM
ncbi:MULTISPECIES: LysR family transcriptional regulator [unclassified Wenzhouxiangella]|uniref:LysR family transcriptional regulator n=1 Tax=unclassified Wenzhouxiangella TaxID=2613841 RepID=UPI000E32A429|nr:MULTISPECIES: LysR family transcriptional regulator [unclassified Wenzhouxiangella]RFF27383.1 LysR family transcriptional regulator [Wenzhouxiangella sp. 15181]RFP68811.1 LysR family transcriptional regulator [Wenzhouxiangella sp. 15190]